MVMRERWGQALLFALLMNCQASKILLGDIFMKNNFDKPIDKMPQYESSHEKS